MSVGVAVAGLVTQLPEDFYGFMLELQGKLAKMIKSVGKIEHALYPWMTMHGKMAVDKRQRKIGQS